MATIWKIIVFNLMKIIVVMTDLALKVENLIAMTNVEVQVLMMLVVTVGVIVKNIL
jgi:hypothetical protein